MDADFGQRLRTQRRALDFTQAALAERVDCSVEMIRKIEAGTARPSPRLQLRLQRVLTVTPAPVVAPTPAWDSAVSFSRWLKGQRQTQNLTQLALATRIGCSGDLVARLESGTRVPSRELAALVAQFFQVPQPEHATFVRWARANPAAGPALAGRLPVPLTVLLGREAEVVHLTQQLTAPACRLLTLSGPGGVGKTHLALVVGQQLTAEFRDGVYFVALAGLSPETPLASAIAIALGLKEHVPEVVLKVLAERFYTVRQLWLVDNFEHFFEQGPFLVQVLNTLPQLKILVTSRMGLGLPGEWRFPVEPLPLPTAAPGALVSLAIWAAVRLFCERAQAVAPKWQLTAHNAPAVLALCQRLEGLPLAIELAAAQANLFTPQLMLKRLSKRLALSQAGPTALPERQRSLEATLAWSYGLLSGSEQRLFRRLAVFQGYWSLEAAEAVGGEPQSPQSVLEGLGQLVNKSLINVAQDDERLAYTMLETMREYALEQLQASEELLELQQRHATYYLAMAEQSAQGLNGKQRSWWLAWQAREHENLHAALRWVLQNKRYEQAGQFAAALGRFWAAQGYGAEGGGWFADILAQSAALAPSTLARVQFAYAELVLLTRRDYQVAQQAFERSRELWQALDAPAGIAQAWLGLGIVQLTAGQWAAAKLDFEQALNLFKQLGDKAGTALALNKLGDTLMYTGAIEEAISLQVASLELFQLLEDVGRAYATLESLLAAALLREDVGQAQHWAEQGIMHAQATGLDNFATETMNFYHTLAMLRPLRPEEIEHLRAGLAVRWRAREIHRVWYYAFSLIKSLADVGQYAKATRLLATLVAQPFFGVRVRTFFDELQARIYPRLQAQFSPAEFAELWEMGKQQTMEQVVQELLQSTY